MLEEVPHGVPGAAARHGGRVREAAGVAQPALDRDRLVVGGLRIAGDLARGLGDVVGVRGVGQLGEHRVDIGRRCRAEHVRREVPREDVHRVGVVVVGQPTHDLVTRGVVSPVVGGLDAAGVDRQGQLVVPELADGQCQLHGFAGRRRVLGPQHVAGVERLPLALVTALPPAPVERRRGVAAQRADVGLGAGVAQHGGARTFREAAEDVEVLRQADRVAGRGEGAVPAARHPGQRA